MAQPPSADKVAAGRARLAARAAHIATLRRRVFASTLATFALLWGVVAFTGSMGTDANTATAQVTSPTTTTSTTDSTDTAATATATATATGDSSSSSSDDNSASTLTTSQS